MAFDSNAMAELAHLSRARYDRNGGGGAFKVYKSAKAYYDAKGYREMSAWDRLMLETKVRWRQAVEGAKADFHLECLVCKEGYYHGDSIPF